MGVTFQNCSSCGGSFYETYMCNVCDNYYCSDCKEESLTLPAEPKFKLKLETGELNLSDFLDNKKRKRSKVKSETSKIDYGSVEYKRALVMYSEMEESACIHCTTDKKIRQFSQDVMFEYLLKKYNLTTESLREEMLESFDLNLRD